MGEALTIALAICLQDIPEGLTAALVLRRMNMTKHRSFFWGQLTGAAQPLAGIAGAAAVYFVETILPYALGFAGAAMLFVIVKDMVPDLLDEAKHRMFFTQLIMGGFIGMSIFSSLIDSLHLDT